MDSLGHHTGTPLMHAWSQWLSLVSEGDPIALFFYLSKARSMWLKLPGSTALGPGTRPLVQLQRCQLPLFNGFLLCLSVSLIPFHTLESLLGGVWP